MYFDKPDESTFKCKAFKIKVLYCQLYLKFLITATNRKLYWKEEKRAFFLNFESLLAEEEEVLNDFLPENASYEQGSLTILKLFLTGYKRILYLILKTVLV